MKALAFYDYSYAYDYCREIDAPCVVLVRDLHPQMLDDIVEELLSGSGRPAGLTCDGFRAPVPFRHFIRFAPVLPRRQRP